MPSSVTIKCPNEIIANAIAYLSEDGKLQEFINTYLQEIGLDEGNSINQNGDQIERINSIEDASGVEYDITFELT